MSSKPANPPKMFWSSTPPPPPPPRPTETPSPPTPPAPPPSSSSSSPQHAEPTRDELADRELAHLIRDLDREHAANAAAAKHAAVVHISEDDRTGLPTEMNCLTAFDEMFYCYSLGGQFLNVYRYGSFRDCSEKSADWRFCLKAKVRGEVAKRAMILARNKEKAAKYKTGKSSEDVWKVRKEPVTDAFGGDFEDLKQVLLGVQQQQQK